MKEHEEILKALANRRRLAILKYLKEHKEASVGEISEQLRLSFQATSKHLGLLFKADLVEREQRSLIAFYRLADDLKSYVKTLISNL